MTNPLPAQARIVIVGGGIAGVSTAYHLTKLGVRDVVLLEQGRLTCGTTWHAAGLVGQTRATRNATRMSRYGIELYSSLEKETGLATGWKRCGSLNVAKTPERLTLMKRQMARAKSFGIEFDFISPAEAYRIAPILRIDDLAGAVWIPGDGKANPTDLTQSLAKGARMGGARIAEGTKVIGVAAARGKVTGVQWRSADGEGTIQCETAVNCGGQWAREFGRLAGVNVPLYSAEHFYLVTKAIPGVSPDLPVIRDPDGFLYYKEEVGGLVMGGFEPEAKPWSPLAIPDGFEFQLLPEDWDHFEILMTNAIHRTPCLETAEVKLLLNGPESFTGDGNFILGEAPELVWLLRACARFNSAGIASSGGAGKLVAEWIVAGEPPLDLWDVDIRRFAPFHANRRHLADRTVESLGLHYAMRWPREELKTVRPLRRSPLYDRLRAKGAVFGSKMGWGARQLLPAGGHRRTALHAGHAGLAAVCSGGTARVPRGRRRVRSDILLEIRAQGPRRASGTATPVRQRHRRGDRAHGVQRDAERPRRIRKRSHHRSRGRARIHDHHRLGADHARFRLDRARHPRRRARRARRCLVRLRGAVADGSEGGGAARPIDLRRACRNRPCRLQRLARSTSAMLGCALRG